MASLACVSYTVHKRDVLAGSTSSFDRPFKSTCRAAGANIRVDAWCATLGGTSDNFFSVRNDFSGSLLGLNSPVSYRFASSFSFQHSTRLKHALPRQLTRCDITEEIDREQLKVAERRRKPLEELYNIKVERQVSKQRLKVPRKSFAMRIGLEIVKELKELNKIFNQINFNQHAVHSPAELMVRQ